ncbi:MAG: group II intron reverse transcriptase domain-containing protein [Anaerolineae bacterium]|nr:group II intron reverse transcriptase domain-containing protein [Anaerolineae bacterium]
MKTYKNLYPQICDFGNLVAAWRKARRGKRTTPAAAALEQALDVELVALQQELAAETYQPGPYRSFTVHEQKRRKISAAPFRDRVAHHALCNVIGPIYERKFIDDSFANRVGKGTHKALDRCTHFMRRYPYVLQCDVEQFFPAIDHAVLKAILARTIADRATLGLCGKIIDSGAGVLTDEYAMRYFAGDDLFAAVRPRGLPIGNLTSQFWANVYLNEMDQFVKRDLKCAAYVRYVDECLLFHNDIRQLHTWRQAVIERLAALRLTLHEGPAQPHPVTEGVSFLGFTVYPTHRRLRRHKAVHARRRFKRLVADYAAGALSLADLQSHVRGWVNHARFGDTWGLRRSILAAAPLPAPV